MKIKQIEITNFKGIGHRVIDFSPVNMLVGKNGQGKSTVFQALEFALLGITPDDPLKTGEDFFRVNLIFENGAEIERERDYTKKNPTTVVKFNRKRVKKEDAQEEIRKLFGGVADETMHVISSSQVLDSLTSGDLGDLIMTYVPHKLDFDTVISYISGIQPDETQELSYLLPEMPNKFGMPDIENAYDKACEERKLALQEVRGYVSRLATMSPAVPQRSDSEVSAELDIVMQCKGKQDVLKTAWMNYKRSLEAKKADEAAIAAMKNEADAMRQVPADMNLVSEYEKDIAALSSDIEAAKETLGILKEKVSSTEKTLATFGGDKCALCDDIECRKNSQEWVALKESMNEDLDSFKRGVEIQNGIVTKKSSELTQKKIRLENEKAANEEYKRFLVIQGQINKKMKNVYSLVAPEDMSEDVDYSQREDALKAEKEIIREYQEVQNLTLRQAKAQARFDLYKKIAEDLSPKGCVRNEALKLYIGVLENECNKKAGSLRNGFQIRLSPEDGITVLVSPRPGTDFIPYKSLSSGEKAMTLFLIADMLNSLTGFNILFLDDLEKLDVSEAAGSTSASPVYDGMLPEFINIVTSPGVLAQYSTILMAAVDHDDVVKAVSPKVNVIQM